MDPDANRGCVAPARLQSPRSVADACREAALSLIRSDLERAGETLDSLAELFRALTRDKRRLISRRPDVY